jgi:hypothetical protein
MRASSVVLGIVLLGVPFTAFATEVPGLVPVQGRLVDADGAPVTDAELTFVLVGDGDVELQAFAPSVTFDDNGFFTASLGELGDLDLAWFRDNATVRLEVEINGDADTGLEFDLGQAPTAGFAFLAGDAETVEGMGAEEFLAADYAPKWSDLVGLDGAAGAGLLAPETDGGALSIDTTYLDTLFATDSYVDATTRRFRRPF